MRAQALLIGMIERLLVVAHVVLLVTRQRLLAAIAALPSGVFDPVLKLGNDMKLDVWVARNDRGRSMGQHRFADLPRLRSSLPRQFDEVTIRIIEHIDVLWLRENAIVAAVEIESTTSIYSGLLRTSDLLAMQPNLNIDLYIVAPDERRSKVITEINRPTFARLSQPLSSVCRFIPFSELRRRVTEVASYVSYLSPRFIDELAEECAPDVD